MLSIGYSRLTDSASSDVNLLSDQTQNFYQPNADLQTDPWLNYLLPHGFKLPRKKSNKVCSDPLGVDNEYNFDKNVFRDLGFDSEDTINSLVDDNLKGELFTRYI